jgi:small conductance mechanosensitive channel
MAMSVPLLDPSSGWPVFVFTVLLVILAIVLINAVLRARHAAGEGRFGQHIVMILLIVLGLVVITIAAPIEKDTRNQLLSLLGVAITAVIALSSTTFVSNAMAGILLRSMSRFKPGDFIRVGEYLGRVTERGLFHTEVQTADRDLATFPNFYLMSNPIKVVRASGTIVSATVSLGYDVSHTTARDVLTEAAASCGLSDPFTRVVELGDFSITYRVSGFLEDVKQLVAAPSKLRTAMLDGLHAADIEIVSPNFMIQRQQRPEEKVLAAPEAAIAEETETDAASDAVFDKAEAAGRIEELKSEREAIQSEIRQIREKLQDADDREKSRMERGMHLREQRIESIAQAIAEAEESLKNSA